MIPINSKHVKVLLDSGDSKSYISKEFMRKLNCEIQVLDEPLVHKDNKDWVGKAFEQNH